MIFFHYKVSVLLGVGDGTFNSAVNYDVGSNPRSVTAGDFNGDGKADLAVANYYSNNVSVLINTTPFSSSGAFESAASYDTGFVPYSVAAGDFNRDGKSDIALANGNSDSVSVLLGIGDGTFSSSVNYSVGIWPAGVAVGDFNRDGKPDLVAANYSSNNISVLLGNGDGTFNSAANYGVGTGPSSIAVGDFNGDGRLDLSISNNDSDNVSVLLGKGDGTFNSAVNYGTEGDYPYSVITGDFNGDGKADLAAANVYSYNVSVFLGVGDGTFNSAVNYSAGTNAISVTTGDFNRDGKADLAVASSAASNNVSVLLGNGNGTFNDAVYYTAGSYSTSVATGDLNRDGNPDIVVGNNDSDDVSILLGNGDGTFNASVNYSGGDAPRSVAIGDFNNDGKPDLAIANPNNNKASILLNTQPCVSPPANMVSWWKAENNADDSKGSNNGTLQGGMSFDSGLVGQAFSFDGSDDYVNLSNPIPDMTASTITVWTYYTGGSNVGTIFMDATSDGGNDFLLDMTSSAIGINANKSDAGSDYENGGAVSGLDLGNAWHFIAWTMTATESRIYVDGNLVQTISEGGSNVGYHASYPSIGRWWDEGSSTRYFSGLIDELALFNRALSADEIAAIYSAGSAGQCTIEQYTLTVNKTGPGSGSVTSEDEGIDCNAECSEDTGLYNPDTLVTLTATPSEGSAFAGWSGDEDCEDGEVTMNASKTCTAEFITTEPLPDLTGSWDGPITETCKVKRGILECRVKGRLIVRNIGEITAAGLARVNFYLSEDDSYGDGDILLKEDFRKGIRVGKDYNRPFHLTLPAGMNLDGRYIIVYIDSDDDIEESNERNNFVVYGEEDR